MPLISTSRYHIMPGVAIVTGASRGIGRAIACRLVRDGYKVALNDLPSQRNELEALRSDLARPGNEIFISPADVSVESEVKAMIDDVVGNMGGLDVVCEPFPSQDTKLIVPSFRDGCQRRHMYHQTSS